MMSGITSTNDSNLGQSKDGNTMYTHTGLSSLFSEVRPPYSSFGFDEQEKEINDAEYQRDSRHNYIRNGADGDQIHESPDALLAYELNQLSFKERGVLENDIHGIQPECIKETPELLRGSLKQLSIELDSIPEKNKTAYEFSQKTFPKTTYVNTDDFRLIFLRCDRFDARKAAQRIVGYLDLILLCFGEQGLEQDIRVSDLDERSEQLLKMGQFQILPSRDHSGRRILGNFSFAAHHRIQAVDPITRLKVGVCMMMVLARDNIDVQNKGLVGIFWAHHFRMEDLNKRSIAITKMIPCMPVRFCSLHVCLTNVNNLAKMANAMYLYAIGPDYRKRTRVHLGSAVECVYALQTFGIQAHDIPINTTTGKRKTQNHQKWVELQQKRDGAIAENKSFLAIECPKQNDILFGRGWPKMGHPGNVLFRNLIQTRLEDYNNSRSKGEKTTMAYSIVLELKENRARFLREDEINGGWIEVSNELARKKVSIAFRCFRRAETKSNKPLASSAAKRKSNQIDPVLSLCQSWKANSMIGINGEQDEGSSAFLDMDGSSNNSIRSNCNV